MTELTDKTLDDLQRCAEAAMRSVTITDPPTVLALVGEVRRLREERDRYREALERIVDYSHWGASADVIEEELKIIANAALEPADGR